MPPCATGFERNRNATIPTTMATTTSAMATGAAGGSVRFALSNSSVIGTCPASYSRGSGFCGDFLSAIALSERVDRKLHVALYQGTAFSRAAIGAEEGSGLQPLTAMFAQG